MSITPRKTVQGVILAGAAVVLGLVEACYPGSIENVQETDVVVTRRDTSANFAGFLLYAMPDTVVQINDTAEGSVELSHEFDGLMIATVEQNMAALGYVRVDIPDDPNDLPQDSVPDLLVLVTMVGVDNSYYVWYPGWGYVGRVSYETGTVFVDMIDPNDPTPGVEPPEIPVVWTGALRGILSGGAATAATRIVDGLNQAFDQSPYLGRN
jgi:hypothetical protein